MEWETVRDIVVVSVQVFGFCCALMTCWTAWLAWNHPDEYFDIERIAGEKLGGGWTPDFSARQSIQAKVWLGMHGIGALLLAYGAFYNALGWVPESWGHFEDGEFQSTRHGLTIFLAGPSWYMIISGIERVAILEARDRERRADNKR